MEKQHTLPTRAEIELARDKEIAAAHAKYQRRIKRLEETERVLSFKQKMVDENQPLFSVRTENAIESCGLDINDRSSIAASLDLIRQAPGVGKKTMDEITTWLAQKR
jgi:hypothetical protein